VVVDGVVDWCGELVAFVEVEGSLPDLLLFHEVWVVFVDPFNPTVAVDQNEMFRGEKKVGDDLPLKIAFEVIADNLFLGVSGICEYIFAIA
jgi:hypothetical protein